MQIREAEGLRSRQPGVQRQLTATSANSIKELKTPRHARAPSGCPLSSLSLSSHSSYPRVLPIQLRWQGWVVCVETAAGELCDKATPRSTGVLLSGNRTSTRSTQRFLCCHQALAFWPRCPRMYHSPSNWGSSTACPGPAVTGESDRHLRGDRMWLANRWLSPNTVGLAGRPHHLWC